MRLRRSTLTEPGYGRRRSGKGFRYLDTDGTALTDPAAVRRIKELVIPPAWRDVWISTDPRGHIQAVGVDAAGRKQYQYHPRWRSARDLAKFEHAAEVAGRLPEIRDRITGDLAGRGLSRCRVLASITRLLDMGAFRIGNDQYAQREQDPSFGLSTLRPEHIRARGGCVVLEFVGKSGKEHAIPVGDGEVCQVLRDLKRRRRGEERLFAYWNAAARAWQEIRADEINDYLREISGEQMTAKDFRTWHGTVKAAAVLAAAGPADTGTARRKNVSHAMKEVSELLGNTPAVARSSYVDPRVVAAYERGRTVAEPTEQAVLELLGDRDSFRA